MFVQTSQPTLPPTVLRLCWSSYYVIATGGFTLELADLLQTFLWYVVRQNQITTATDQAAVFGALGVRTGWQFTDVSALLLKTAQNFSKR